MNYSYYRRYRTPKRKTNNFSSFLFFVVFLMVLVLILKICIGTIMNLKEEHRDEAILTINQGSADITLWGHEDSQVASSAQIILEGDTISTGDGSYVTLSFQNGSEVRMDANSRLIFESFEKENNDDFVSLDLVKGRAYVVNLPKENGVMDLTLKTDIMNLLSYSGEYLAMNSSDQEYVYGIEGQVNVQYLDRAAPEDLLVDEVTLLSGTKSAFDAIKRHDFLARSAVVLVGDMSDDLIDDGFYLWNIGQVYLPEPTDREPESDSQIDSEPEVIPVIESEPLRIALDSPESGSVIDKSAVAISGKIVSGTASKVTVSWSGNGEAYPLGLFSAGDSGFRYVADVDYSNFMKGENTYTIVAYDENGVSSNAIVVRLVGEF